MVRLASAALLRQLVRRYLGIVSFATIVAALAAAPGSLPVQAQQPPGAAAAPPAGFIQVTTVTVKPAAIVEFEDYVKKAVAAVTKTTNRPVLAYQRMFGNTSQYFFVVSLTAEKDLDGMVGVPEAVIKTYGQAEGARLLATGRAAVESITVERHDTLPGISTNLRPAAAGAPTRYYQVMRTEFKPEMGAEYRLILEKIKKAEEAQPNATTAIRRTVSEGGSPYTLIVIRGFNSFAERDEWPNQREAIRKAYGADEDRQMNAAIQRAVVARESTVLVHRADLSSQPGAAAARP